MSQTEEFTSTLVTRIAPSMLEALQQRASQQDRPVSWLVRKAITDMLSAEKRDAS